jgi:DUF1680 family protein
VLRVPDWAKGAKAGVNGKPVDIAAGLRKGYLAIGRTWKKGDIVELDLPMPPARIFAHPAVKADRGRTALRRGPLIYCLEAADNPGSDLSLVQLPREAPLTAEKRDELFDGAVLLTAEGREPDATRWNDALYSSEPPPMRATGLTALPYFLWANREPGAMRVWIAET